MIIFELPTQLEEGYGLSLSIYQASIPAFVQMLNNLSTIFDV